MPQPVAAAAAAAGTLELVDPEGLPLARVTVEATYEAGDATGISGAVTALTHHQFGAFRRLYLSPTQVVDQYGGRTLTVPVAAPLTRMGIAVLSLAGLFIAAYLLLHRLGVVGTLECGADGGCSVVQSSRWAVFLGIPVPAWGVGGYGLLFGTALAGMGVGRRRKRG